MFKKEDFDNTTALDGVRLGTRLGMTVGADVVGTFAGIVGVTVGVIEITGGVTEGAGLFGGVTTVPQLPAGRIRILFVTTLKAVEKRPPEKLQANWAVIVPAARMLPAKLLLAPMLT